MAAQWWPGMVVPVTFPNKKVTGIQIGQRLKPPAAVVLSCEQLAMTPKRWFCVGSFPGNGRVVDPAITATSRSNTRCFQKKPPTDSTNRTNEAIDDPKSRRRHSKTTDLTSE